jgi:4-amino-4-deoxy-L-arabinose transferase-like glycosyltransferase
MSSPSLSHRFWALVLGFTVFRLAVAGQFGLGADESHYAMFARRLAWGYFDHPPMVGFLAALTGWGGRSSFLLRLGPILCWLASMAILRDLARRLYGDERVAFRATLVLCLLPIGQLLGIALLPDAPLALFWCATLWSAWRAMRTGRTRWWLAVGACAGAALLSKYHGVLLPAALAGYVLTSPRERRWTLNWRPYAACALAALVFLPNVLWNARHEWMSYAYQSSRGGSGGLRLDWMASAIGGQLAAGSPVLFVLLVVAGFALWRRSGPLAARDEETREADRFVLWTSLPIFALFGGIGLFGKVLPHWPAIGWWTGALAVAVAWTRAEDAGGARARRWSRAARVGLRIAAVMVALTFLTTALPVAALAHDGLHRASVALHRRFPGIPALPPYVPKFDVTNDVHGWDEAGARVSEIRAAMPNPDRTFVHCHLFLALSQLLVHMDPATHGASLRQRPTQYRVWFDPAKHVGWDALFVDEDHSSQGPGTYAAFFERVDPTPVEIVTRRWGFPSHILRVYRCYGFKGARTD